MKKHLFACGLIVAASAPIFAQNSRVSLIREDRVWEYRKAVYGNAHIASCRMKFDGTRNVAGQTYHKFIPVDMSMTTVSLDGNDTIYNREALPYEYHESLLREEDGKVYLIAPDYLNGGHDYSSNPEEWTADTPLIEHLLYDFNLGEGDTLHGVCDGGLGSFAQGYVTLFDIDSVSEVTIDGETCRLQYSKGKGGDAFGTDDLPPYRIYDTYFLEGVGVLAGCASMTYIPTYYTTGMGDDWFTLARVYNENGEIIFPLPGAEYPLDWTFEDHYIPEEYGVSIHGPSNSVKSVQENSRKISYSAGVVRAADGAEVVVYDMAGKRVAQGRGSLSTASLQPGVYIVKSSGATLKITVK